MYMPHPINKLMDRDLEILHDEEERVVANIYCVQYI